MADDSNQTQTGGIAKENLGDPGIGPISALPKDAEAIWNWLTSNITPLHPLQSLEHLEHGDLDIVKSLGEALKKFSGEKTAPPKKHEKKAWKDQDKELKTLEHTPLSDLNDNELTIIQDEAGRGNKTADRILKAWNKAQPGPAKSISQMLTPFTKGLEQLPQIYGQLSTQAANLTPSIASADAAAQKQGLGMDTYSPTDQYLQPSGGNVYAGQSPLALTGSETITPSIPNPTEQTDQNANAMEAYVNQGAPNAAYMESVLGQAGQAGKEFQSSVPESSLIQTLLEHEQYGLETGTLTTPLPEANRLPQYLQQLYEGATGLNIKGNSNLPLPSQITTPSSGSKSNTSSLTNDPNSDIG